MSVHFFRAQVAPRLLFADMKEWKMVFSLWKEIDENDVCTPQITYSISIFQITQHLRCSFSKGCVKRVIAYYVLKKKFLNFLDLRNETLYF